MKKLAKILLLVLALSLCFTLLAACSECDKNGHKWVNGVCTVCEAEYDLHDYVADLKLNMNSNTVKYTQSTNFIHMYIDGDTTHFKIEGYPDDYPEGVLKARYLAVNTPESTGKVEPYGKVASNYTHDTLQAAIDNGGQVLVESELEDGKWHKDSYGRTTAWIWYKPDADSDWRNLNLELLQKGLGYGSSVSDNIYGEICLKALNQAMDAKLTVHSGVKDELFYYGDAQEITLKELRVNFDQYEQTKVAFFGYVAESAPGSSGGINAYVQAYDEEDGIYYGMAIFTNSSMGKIKTALQVGNYVRIVGTATDFNGTLQVSGLSYNIANANDPNNTRIVEDEDPGEYTYEPMEMTIADFNKTINIEYYDHTLGETIRGDFQTCKLLVGTAIKMTNLYVYDVYTTDSGTSKGAITLYCRDSSGNTITVRTEVLTVWDDELQKAVTVTEDRFDGKYITVWGIVDWFNYNNNNSYQIRVAYLDNFLTISDTSIA